MTTRRTGARSGEYGDFVTQRDWRPRYLQVAEDLRSEILRGRIQPGSPLPSEADLSETYGLSRTSVRAAIRQLREWGLVRAEQGRGTYVRAPRQRVTRTPERYQWEKDRVRLPGEERAKTGATEFDTGLSLDDLEFRVEYHTLEADDELAAEFDVPKGTRLLQRLSHVLAARGCAFEPSALLPGV